MITDTKYIEALKLALEVLEEIESYYGYDRSVGAMASSMYEASNLAKITSTRIREALMSVPDGAEQPAQQPVTDHSCKDAYELIMKWADIYAAQTGRLYSEAAQDSSKVARMADERTMLACAVAQALSQQAQQEPDTKDVVINNMGRPFTVKAYVTPQPAQHRKPWVGLTNQELIDLTAIYSGGPLYCAIEVKLREKNA